MELIITNHAIDRTKQRVGISKRLAEKNAMRAYESGIKHSETSGSLKRYLDKLYLEHKTSNNVRIYCGNIYIFHGDILLTVFPLPEKYRKTAERIKTKRKEG